MKFPSTVPGDTALVLNAVAFAEKAHRGQVRKYTGEPYFTHCLTVAGNVALRTMDPHVISAAVLHDVMEDTDTNYHDLLMTFGERVAELVNGLTDKYTHWAYPECNRQARKKMEAERLGACSAEVQLIKVYDLMDNTASITAHDPGFAEVYLPEKRFLLDRMTKVDAHERLLLAIGVNRS